MRRTEPRLTEPGGFNPEPGPSSFGVLILKRIASSINRVKGIRVSQKPVLLVYAVLKKQSQMFTFSKEGKAGRLTYDRTLMPFVNEVTGIGEQG
jgi:hypothetical protein